MQRILGIFLVCLVAVTHCHVRVASSCDSTSRSYELCRDFRDIRNLIDPNTLLYFVTSGFYSDANFRTAMKYIESDSFESISNQIANSAPYKELLTRFSDAGVNTGTISSIANIFKCLMLEKPKYSDADGVTSLEYQSVVVARSMSDIATKIKSAIPKNKFRSLVRDKLDEDGDFAKFYKVARSSSFRSAAKKMFKSYQLKYPLKVLTSNHIDLKGLAKFAAEILDWGPKY